MGRVYRQGSSLVNSSLEDYITLLSLYFLLTFENFFLYVQQSPF